MMKPEHSYKKRLNVGSIAGNGLRRGTIIKQMKPIFCSVQKYCASKDVDLRITKNLGIFAKSSHSPAFAGF